MKRRNAKIKPPPPPKGVRRAEWKARFARVLGLAFCAAGFGAIALGWAGAARKTCVDCQIPYLISGGAAGVALVVLGAGMLLIAQMRTEARRLSARLEQMTWTLAERFMGAATGPVVKGETNHLPTEEADARVVEPLAGKGKGSSGVAVDTGKEDFARASAEPGAPPNPWWER
jgi:hypothetical protein